MLKIDSHNHFWNYDEKRDSWITPDMAMLQQDFLPQHFYPVLRQHSFDGCVVVQSNQCDAENEFQLAQAATNDFVKGVVGWVDLQSENIEAELARYQANKKMKGFRHILQGEANRALMLEPAFKNGIGLLAKYGFTYDLLIYPDQLQYAITLVRDFPNQLFVMNHLAKPFIKKGDINEWQTEIQKLAQYPNVYCKISGMVTEANWHQWTQNDFTPYLDVVISGFGTNRIMYGSDWPVCLLSATYTGVLGIVQKYFASFSDTEQQLFFGGNATTFYNL